MSGRKRIAGMNRRSFFKSGAAALAGSALLRTLLHASPRVPALASGDGKQPEVPSLEDLASAWLDCDELAQMPSLHNFREMAACAPDIAGVNFWPGGQLWAKSGPRWYRYHTLPLCELRLDGRSCDAETCRWYAYEAVRKAHADGLEIVTTNRLVSEDTTVLWHIEFRNTGTVPRTFEAAIRLAGVLNTDGQSHTVHYADAKSGLSSVYAFLEDAAYSQPDKDVAEVQWKLTLEPGQRHAIRFAMAAGRSGQSPSSTTVGQTDLAGAFVRNWDAARTIWEERWRAAFTPGNRFFSGHVPGLVTGDAAISEIYYRSILTLMVLLRTGLWSNRVFITSGERAEGLVFYWDTSLFSTIFALLEPRAMKEQIKWFLQLDPHESIAVTFGGKRPPVPASIPVLPGWDLRGYAANDVSIFRLAVAYLAVNQDKDFLHEPIADQTVLKRLEVLATNWKKLLRKPGDRLADYGEAENLLECVPTYINQVPSFNAANVWMMRELAEMLERDGDREKARNLRAEADSMAAAVMTLYIPGTGYWWSQHRDGSRVEMRHCYDFATVARFMTDDLPKPVKAEMVGFVERELLTQRWMRAQSLHDVAAAQSDRPDHGPMGAYDAWPAVTVDAMCYLGFWPQAISFLRRTQAGLREGVYAQAHEFYGPNRRDFDAPVRIAMREECMRESSAGGAFAETVITTLFGYDARLGHGLALYDSAQNRGFSGELLHVRHGAHLFTLRSAPAGVSLMRE